MLIACGKELSVFMRQAEKRKCGEEVRSDARENIKQLDQLG
jgi:hypothetical protein